MRAVFCFFVLFVSSSWANNGFVRARVYAAHTNLGPGKVNCTNQPFVDATFEFDTCHTSFIPQPPQNNVPPFFSIIQLTDQTFSIGGFQTITCNGNQEQPFSTKFGTDFLGLELTPSGVNYCWLVEKAQQP